MKKQFFLLFILISSYAHVHAMEKIQLDTYHGGEYLKDDVLLSTINAGRAVDQTPENNNFLKTCNNLLNVINTCPEDKDLVDHIQNIYPKVKVYSQMLLEATDKNQLLIKKLQHAVCASSDKDKTTAWTEWLKAVRYFRADYWETNTSLRYPSIPNSKSKLKIPNVQANIKTVLETTIKANAQYDIEKDEQALITGILLGSMLKQTYRTNIPKITLADLPLEDPKFITKYFNTMSIKPTIAKGAEINQVPENNNLLKTIQELLNTFNEKDNPLETLYDKYPSIPLHTELLWKKTQANQEIKELYNHALNTVILDNKIKKLTALKGIIFRYHAAEWEKQISVHYPKIDDVRESDNEDRSTLYEKQRKRFIEVNAEYDEKKDKEKLCASFILAPQVNQFVTRLTNEFINK